MIGPLCSSNAGMANLAAVPVFLPGSPTLRSDLSEASCGALGV